MWYSEEEIIYEISHAVNPYEQIRILAELNGCSIKEIQDIWKKAGNELPKFQRRDNIHGLREKWEKDHLTISREKQKKREWYLRNREQILKKQEERRRKKGIPERKVRSREQE